MLARRAVVFLRRLARTPAFNLGTRGTPGTFYFCQNALDFESGSLSVTVCIMCLTVLMYFIILEHGAVIESSSSPENVSPRLKRAVGAASSRCYNDSCINSGPWQLSPCHYHSPGPDALVTFSNPYRSIPH